MQSSIDSNPYRLIFPRGLTQPTHGFRFSVDALLLAGFTAGQKPKRVIDLGMGCGVVSFGLFLLHPNLTIHILGVDNNREMVAAARINAQYLGFENSFFPVFGDVSAMREIQEFQAGTFDTAICNPPYRLSGHGRLPSGTARQSATIESRTGLGDFLKAASMALGNKGRLCLVHLPEHLQRLVEHLTAVKLVPKKLLFIHPHQDKPATLLLLEARKGGNPGMSVEPPLVLYHRERTPEGNYVHCLTNEALNFCPFLQCNHSRPEFRLSHAT